MLAERGTESVRRHPQAAITEQGALGWSHTHLDARKEACRQLSTPRLKGQAEQRQYTDEEKKEAGASVTAPPSEARARDSSRRECKFPARQVRAKGQGSSEKCWTGWMVAATGPSSSRAPNFHAAQA